MIEPEVKYKILTAVDCLQDELVKVVSDIVQIPSINPTLGGVNKEEVTGGETRVNAYLKGVEDGMSLDTDLWEEEPGRGNLVGVWHGVGQGRSLIFNGHVDVVAPGPEALWTVAGPWSGKVVDGKIYGRGSTDMKGGDVCTIMALKAVLDAGYKPRGDVILETVAGEELMNTEVGTSMTVKRGYRADAAIVAEASAPPHRLAILTASPGCLLGRVTIKGKPAHTSMRDEMVRAGGRGSTVAVSAVDKAMIIYQGLRRLEEEWGLTKSHPAFTRPGHFTISPTTFAGGLNGIAFIPEECYIDYVVWHAPQETGEQVKAEIETHIQRLAQTDPWLRENPPTVDWNNFWWPPYDVPLDAPIAQAAAAAYEDAFDQPAKFYGFTAVDDASFLNAAGIPTVTLGPGSVEIAHTANEHIKIQDLLDATKVYALTIAEWCGI